MRDLEDLSVIVDTVAVKRDGAEGGAVVALTMTTYLPDDAVGRAAADDGVDLDDEAETGETRIVGLKIKGPIRNARVVFRAESGRVLWDGEMSVRTLGVDLERSFATKIKAEARGEHRHALVDLVGELGCTADVLWRDLELPLSDSTGDARLDRAVQRFQKVAERLGGLELTHAQPDGTLRTVSVGKADPDTVQ